MNNTNQNNNPTIHIILKEGLIDVINVLNMPKAIQIIVQDHDLRGAITFEKIINLPAGTAKPDLMAEGRK